MKTTELNSLYQLATSTQTKSVKIADVNLISKLTKARSKEIKKFANNRKNGIQSVFYPGDKFLMVDCNCFGQYTLIAGEVVNSEWDKAYGVHSPNGLVNTIIKHGNENTNDYITSFVSPFDLFLIN